MNVGHWWEEQRPNAWLVSRTPDLQVTLTSPPPPPPPPQEEGYSNTNTGRFRENVLPVCFSYTIFEGERYPFHTLSIENCTFFTFLERGYYIYFLSFLHRSNPLKYLNESTFRWVYSRYFGRPLKYLKYLNALMPTVPPTLLYTPTREVLNLIYSKLAMVIEIPEF